MFHCAVFHSHYSYFTSHPAFHKFLKWMRLYKNARRRTVNCRLGSITSVPEEIMEQVILEAASQTFEEWEDNWEQHRFTGTNDAWPIHYVLEWNECSVVEGIAVDVVYLDKASDVVSHTIFVAKLVRHGSGSGWRMGLLVQRGVINGLE